MSTWKCKDMVASLKKNMWNRKWTCNELLECSLGQHLSFSAHRGGLTCHSAKPKVESDTAPAFTPFQTRAKYHRLTLRPRPEQMNPGRPHSTQVVFNMQTAGVTEGFE